MAEPIPRNRRLNGRRANVLVPFRNRHPLINQIQNIFMRAITLVITFVTVVSFVYICFYLVSLRSRHVHQPPAKKGDYRPAQRSKSTSNSAPKAVASLPKQKMTIEYDKPPKAIPQKQKKEIVVKNIPREEKTYKRKSQKKVKKQQVHKQEIIKKQLAKKKPPIIYKPTKVALSLELVVQISKRHNWVGHNPKLFIYTTGYSLIKGPIYGDFTRKRNRKRYHDFPSITLPTGRYKLKSIIFSKGYGSSDIMLNLISGVSVAPCEYWKDITVNKDTNLQWLIR